MRAACTHSLCRRPLKRTNYGVQNGTNYGVLSNCWTETHSLCARHQLRPPPKRQTMGTGHFRIFRGLPKFARLSYLPLVLATCEKHARRMLMDSGYHGHGGQTSKHRLLVRTQRRVGVEKVRDGFSSRPVVHGSEPDRVLQPCFARYNSLFAIV
jgi:hypothetical protein